MKIIVALKRVPSQQVQMRALPDGSAADLAGAAMNINPFDENALEEAVRLKERGLATEVIAISFGEPGVQEILRQALALGATRAIWGKLGSPPDQLAVAKLLRYLAEIEAPSLIILGKQAVDGDAGVTAQMLAGLLDWPQATGVSRLEVAGNSVIVRSEVEGGHETLSLTLPAVLSADLTLNAPRFAKLSELMKARRQTLEVLDCEALGLYLRARLTTRHVVDASGRAAGQRLGSVEELLQRLKNDERVVS